MDLLRVYYLDLTVVFSSVHHIDQDQRFFNLFAATSPLGIGPSRCAALASVEKNFLLILKNKKKCVFTITEYELPSRLPRSL